MLNLQVLQAVKKTTSQLLVVTKYLSAAQTLAVLPEILAQDFIIGVGENREKALLEKDLPRDLVHFIGRIQSRKLPTILSHCAVIHSLENLDHAKKIESYNLENNLLNKIFVQVNVAQDPSKSGIKPESLESFLSTLNQYQTIEVVGLSSMGWGEFEHEQKVKEFQDLIQLRDTYLPHGLTSAGTSRDYDIALKQGIDIVRVGKDLF